VATLVGVFGRLLRAGATIIVVDHDLDLLVAADYLIDMGPGGGPDGGPHRRRRHARGHRAHPAA
jgi:excinuclease ABC subunit A